MLYWDLVVSPHKCWGNRPISSDVSLRVVMSKGKVSPFSNGTQYSDWSNANCNRCKKSAQQLPESSVHDCDCDIEEALLEAYIADGEVEYPIANRMGYFLNQGKDNWVCPEVDWTEE